MVYGWVSEQFLRYHAYNEVNGVMHSRACPGDPSRSVLSNASGHNEHEYIWSCDLYILKYATMLLLAVFGVYQRNEIMLTLVRGRGSVRFWRY